MRVFVAALVLLTACPGATAPARAGLVDEVLAGLALRDQDDRPFAPAQLRGRAVLVSFIFTRCPSICPTQVEALAAVRRALPDDLRARVALLSVSVDPAHDTPAALRRFAEIHDALQPGWSFVTAPGTDVDLLTRRLGALDPRPGASLPDAHSTALYLFDADGRLVQRYAGAPVDRARLARELTDLDSRRRRPR